MRKTIAFPEIGFRYFNRTFNKKFVKSVAKGNSEYARELFVDEAVLFGYLDGNLEHGSIEQFYDNVIIPMAQIAELQKKLGKEANDETIDVVEFYQKIHKMRIKVKTALLDQTLIAGLGNIYVDEVIHKSGLHPEELGMNVTLDDCKNIKDASKDIITKATLGGGTTIRSYTSSLNVYGTYQHHLKVHTKEVCGDCGTKITKIRVGGRGTYFCDMCQKKK